MKDIIITLPSDINWVDYQKELNDAEKGEILNFKVSEFPVNTSIGRKCYVTYKGYIKGYMYITGMTEKNFDCTTTGKYWEGKFIERTGKFYEVTPIVMKGFQGFRYYTQQ